MAHHVYQSEAFVLRGANIGEANRFVDIFTRELGLVRAVAQSARRERSKMRYSLQNYTHLHVSLVRGREVWRVTGVHEITNPYYIFKGRAHKQEVYVKIHVLLRRLLHGEEKNEALFESIHTFLEFLKREDIPKNDMPLIEILMVLRILYHLGYVGNKEALFTSNEFSSELLKDVREHKKRYVQEINEALQESQL